MDDTALLDHLDAVAERRGCGWMIDRGVVRLKHWSQEPPFSNVREAIKAAKEAEQL
jgi:hypothetical protein